MTRIRPLLLGVSTLLISAAVAVACDLPWIGPAPGASTSHSFYVPYTYTMPASPVVFCQPAPMPLARPKAAPPSGEPVKTTEPPVSKGPSRGPQIDHYRAIGGIVQNPEPRQRLVKTSFWNLSGFDLDLTVGDKVQRVGKDRATIVELDRTFTWKTNFHSPKTETVPDDLNHFEVLIK